MKKRLASCFLALLMLIGSFVGSKKIIGGKLCSCSPNAAIAIVATGGSFAAFTNAVGLATLNSLGVDAAELTFLFDAAAQGATQAELMAMFGATFGVWFAISVGVAVVA